MTKRAITTRLRTEIAALKKKIRARKDFWGGASYKRLLTINGGWVQDEKDLLFFQSILELLRG